MPRGIPKNSRDQARREYAAAFARIQKLKLFIAEAYIEMAKQAKVMSKALTKLSKFG